MELLTFPLEGKDKFIEEMKTFNDGHQRAHAFYDPLYAQVGRHSTC